MTVRTPVVYLGVAGLCILLHNAVMIAGDAVGVGLLSAVLLSFVCVATTGYVLHGLLTFRQPLGLIGFARYAIAMSLNIPIAFATTWLWHDAVGLRMALAAPIASVCMIALNFILGRWAITAPRTGLVKPL